MDFPRAIVHHWYWPMSVAISRRGATKLTSCGAMALPMLSPKWCWSHQAGTGYFPVLVQAIAKDPNFDAICVMISYDASPDSVTGPKKTGIVTPKDLNGRKIAAQPNAPTTLMFSPFAKAVEENWASWVEVAPELMSVVTHQGQAEGVAQYSSSAIVAFETGLQA